MSVLDALQTALAAEHAALYVYGVLGGADLAVGDARRSTTRSPRRTPPTASRRDQLRAAGHRGRRRAGRRRAGVRRCRPRLARSRAGRTRRRSTSRRPCADDVRPGGPVAGAVREWALAEATWSATWQLELGGAAQTWPGRSRAWLSARAAGSGPRPRLGKVPRSLPEAEDADRLGLVSITLCGSSCGGGGAACTIMHSDPRGVSASHLHVRASHKGAGRPSAGQTPLRSRRRTTAGISLSAVHDGVRLALAVADLRRRDRAVRDVDRAQPGVAGRPRRRRRAGRRRRRSAPGRSTPTASIAARKACGDGFVHGISLV